MDLNAESLKQMLLDDEIDRELDHMQTRQCEWILTESVKAGKERSCGSGTRRTYV